MKIKQLALFLYLLFVPCIILGQNEQLHSLQSSACSGTAASGAYKLTATSGQTSPPGEAESQNYRVITGFIPVALSEKDIAGPTISVKDVEIPEENSDILIEATVIDDSDIKEVILICRRGGETDTTEVRMIKSNDNYTGTIPARMVTSKGVEFFIQSADVFGNSSRHPVSGKNSIPVSIGGEGLEKTSPQPSGSEQNAYRLISVPMNANDKSSKTILEDDLGEYDNTRWRFFSLQSDQSYAEYPNTGPMTPGKAFWLIVKDAGKKIDIGPAKSNITHESFKIALNKGWTFIGNPFNFDLPMDQLSLENGEPLDIRSYTGPEEWQEYSGLIRPFEGYAVYSEPQTTLIITPSLPGNGFLKRANLLTNNDQQPDWRLTINASIQQVKDIDTEIRIFRDALPGWDNFDKPEAPVIGEYISVYFPHDDWYKIARNFTVDARPEPIEGDKWPLEVRSNIQDRVQLTFQNIDQIPHHLEVWLVDEVLNTTQNLREKNTYLIPQVSEDAPKQLTLIVGTQEYVQEKLEELQLTPATFELSQNFPNPFSAGTSIRYGLPEQSEVLLQVYDLQGQSVINLIDGESQNAGYHVQYWDGSDQFGQEVASGIYFYVLRSEEGTLKKKMVLIK